MSMVIAACWHLQNSTLFRVKLIASDLVYNAQLYTAAVRTVDVKPPLFLSVSV